MPSFCEIPQIKAASLHHAAINVSYKKYAKSSRSKLQRARCCHVLFYCTSWERPLTFSSSDVSWGWDGVQTTATHQALQLHNVTLTPGDRLCQGWRPGLKWRSAELHNWCRCHSMYGSSTWQCITTTKCDIFQKLSNCSLKSGLDWGPRQRTAAGLSICP